MSQPVLSARGLGKVIKGRTILKDVHVEEHRGSVIGVIGRNGAGKTTLLDILLGFSPPTSGESRLFGHDSLALPATVKGRIGFVPQQDELIPMITGAQHLALHSSLHPRWNGDLVARLARTWEVPLDRPVQILSVGERQKLSSLLALGHDPELLVLDEPAASLDPLARRRFLQELLEISSDRTRTILFSTHIVSDLERVADRIWILREGALAWSGDLDTLKESVVRLQVRARRALPAGLALPHALRQQVRETWASALVSQWSPGEVQDLRDSLDAEIEVQSLGLEDLFVELHA